MCAYWRPFVALWLTRRVLVKAVLAYYADPVGFCGWRCRLVKPGRADRAPFGAEFAGDELWVRLERAVVAWPALPVGNRGRVGRDKRACTAPAPRLARVRVRPVLVFCRTARHAPSVCGGRARMTREDYRAWLTSCKRNALQPPRGRFVGLWWARCARRIARAAVCPRQACTLSDDAGRCCDGGSQANDAPMHYFFWKWLYGRKLENVVVNVKMLSSFGWCVLGVCGAPTSDWLGLHGFAWQPAGFDAVVVYRGSRQLYA